MSEYQINEPPSDGITSVNFGPGNSQFLLVSSWDAKIRLYDINSNSVRFRYSHSHPILDCSFQDRDASNSQLSELFKVYMDRWDNVHAYSGGLDNTLKMFDFNSQSETVVGTHELPIRCVHFSSDVNVVITGSWDSTIKLWDPRMPSCSGCYSQPNKVYTLDTVGEKLVVGTAGRKVPIWDLRNMGHAQQIRESSLKYQTRCIRCFPNKQGYVLSSIEGRVSVEYFDACSESLKKYAFKCHRGKENGIDLVYPVNAISFHNIYNTFATGGSDGFVNIWDGFNKKRLCQFHQYPTGITTLAFSTDGSVLAIGSSYNFERGDLVEMPKNNIYIRKVSDLETKPK